MVHGHVINNAIQETGTYIAHQIATDRASKLSMYGSAIQSASKMNARLNTDKSLLKANNNIIKNNTGIQGISGVSSIVNELDNALSFNNDYLLKQKLQNNNTYNRLKSSVVFQNEFLSHVRLNQIGLSNLK